MSLGPDQDRYICDFVRSTTVHVATHSSWSCNGDVPVTSVCPPGSSAYSTWMGITCSDGCVVSIVLDGTQLYANTHGSAGNRHAARKGRRLSSLHGRSMFVEDLVRLSGSLPSTIGQLITLRVLNLPYNALTGTIPGSVGSLTNLYYLNLNNNYLKGSIPSAVGSLVSLTSLSLSGNALTGTIPPSLGALANLRAVVLSGNLLSGVVPTTLCQYVTELVVLDSSSSSLALNKGLACQGTCLNKFTGGSSSSDLCDTLNPVTTLPSPGRGTTI